jgi:hypothetical protein
MTTVAILDRMRQAAADAREKLDAMAWQLARGEAGPTQAELTRLLQAAGQDLDAFEQTVAERRHAIEVWRKLKTARECVRELGSVPPPVFEWQGALATLAVPRLDERQRESLVRHDVRQKIQTEWNAIEAKFAPDLDKARAKRVEAQRALTAIEREIATLRFDLESTTTFDPKRDYGMALRRAVLTERLQRLEAELPQAKDRVAEAEAEVRRLERELIVLVEGTN